MSKKSKRQSQIDAVTRWRAKNPDKVRKYRADCNARRRGRKRPSPKPKRPSPKEQAERLLAIAEERAKAARIVSKAEKVAEEKTSCGYSGHLKPNHF